MRRRERRPRWLPHATVIVLVVAGCGRIGYAKQGDAGPTRDAGDVDAGDVDAGRRDGGTGSMEGPDGGTSRPTIMGVEQHTLAAGLGHACALAAGGSLYCWGLNTRGQLGIGSATPNVACGTTEACAFGPTLVPAVTGVTPMTIFAGGESTCFVSTTGSLYCWGSDVQHQLGDGAGSPDVCAGNGCAMRPVPIALPARVTSVSLGRYHACAVTEGQDLYCWGLGWNGRLGDGTENDADAPRRAMRIASPGYLRVAAGGDLTCGIVDAGNTPTCWGAGLSRGLGDSSPHTLGTCTTPSTASCVTRAQFLVDGIAGILEIASASSFASATCGVRDDGHVRCWGASATGLLGIGTTTEPTEWIDAVGITSATHVDLEQDVACAVHGGGRVSCWGANDAGQVGTGSASASPELTPRSVTGLTDADEVAVGWRFACARRRGGSVVCWGSGDAGRLGQGVPFPESSTPVAVTIP